MNESTTIAAVYARKSTDQSDVSGEQRSVARQVEHASAYAARKGWTVAQEYVFVDDGISGAEFAGRPGFVRLMNAAGKKPRPFDVLIMSEESRLGRESIETAYALKTLVTAGIRVFFYMEDRERTLDSPHDKILMSLTGFADELERERARVRTYDALSRKARAGHVTGGRVFGYDNRSVHDDSGRRLRVERRVNPNEAAVVRQIFERCARGEGIVTIAKALNAAAAPTPRAQQGRPRSWAPSSVREVLHRELYSGVIVWNQTRKRDRWGRVHQASRPKSEHVRIAAEELRIVSQDLWDAVQARLEEARQTYLRGTKGQLWGRPSQGVESKYLLTGLMRCQVCGGSVYVKSRSHGRRRVPYYGCSSYHLRGTSVCTNGVEVDVDQTNKLVLDAFKEEILRPDLVTRTVQNVIAALQPSLADRDARRTALRTQKASVEQEIDRLTAAIAAGADLAPLVTALKAREATRQALKEELASLGNVELVDVRLLDREIRHRLAAWQELLQSQATARPGRC